MPVDSVFQGMDTFVVITVFLFIASLFFGLLLAIFAHIMHFFLSRHLDGVLFNDRWFTHAELNIYSLWPLSLIRSVIYMFLIAFPNRAIKTKRFKGFDLTLPVSPALKMVSKFYIMLHYLTATVGAALLFSVAIYLLFYFQ